MEKKSDSPNKSSNTIDDDRKKRKLDEDLLSTNMDDDDESRRKQSKELTLEEQQKLSDKDLLRYLGYNVDQPMYEWTNEQLWAQYDGGGDPPRDEKTINAFRRYLRILDRDGGVHFIHVVFCPMYIKQVP